MTDTYFSNRDPLDLVREHELAARWQKSLRTLRRWRKQAYGPRHFMIGGTVYYRAGEILAFEEQNSSEGNQP